MFKKILLKIYSVSYRLERWAIRRRIYTECDLYDIRFNYETMKRKKRKQAWKF